jgi:hypothetical protein
MSKLTDQLAASIAALETEVLADPRSYAEIAEST